jgi:hypothetical protein
VLSADKPPVYALEDKQGKLLLYVSTLPHLSLRDYLNRSVSLYGTIAPLPGRQLSQEHMVATHIALP